MGGLLLLVFLSVAAALSGSTSEALPCHDAARAEGVRPGGQPNFTYFCSEFTCSVVIMALKEV